MDKICSFPDDAVLKEEALRAVAKNLRPSFCQFLEHNEHNDVLKLLENYFNVLFNTALSPTISSSHRTACCNLICGTIELCLSLQHDSLVAFGCSRSICDQLQTLYFDCFDSAKEKSMKQVVATLIKALAKTCSTSSLSEEVEQSLQHVFNILFHTRDRSRAKPALFVLNQYIVKDLVNPSNFIEKYSRWKSKIDKIPDDTRLSALQCFILNIFDWAATADAASSVGQVVYCFLNRLPSNATDLSPHYHSSTALPVWAEPLILSVAKENQDIQTFKSYILPGLFQRSCVEFWAFLCYLHVEKHLQLDGSATNPSDTRVSKSKATTERTLLLYSLQVGKELGLIEEYDGTVSRKTIIADNIIYIPDCILVQLLNHGSSEIRLSGLALLLTSKRTTKPYTKKTLQAIANSLPHFYDDPDAEFRSEVQSLVQTFVNRLRVILASLKRDCEKNSHASNYGASSLDKAISHDFHLGRSGNLAKAYQSHVNFLNWYQIFLLSSLHPAASYQHHVSALKSLGILLRSGLDKRVAAQNLTKQAKMDISWPFNMHVVDKPMTRVLLDILLDPFEDVRKESSENLSLVNFGNTEPSSISIFNESVEALGNAQLITAQSGRVDHADGLARLYGLSASHYLEAHNDTNLGLSLNSKTALPSVLSIVYDIIRTLEDSIVVATSDIFAAVNNHSIHGYFTSLRYVLEAIFLSKPIDKNASASLSQILDRAVQSVSNVWICVNPILCNDAPEGFLPVDSRSSTASTKDILSFAWRALKESSLLLQCLNTRQAQHLTSASGELVFKRLEVSGDLCFKQLANIRHRGAFATVAQTFAFICSQCANERDERSVALLKSWYRESLELILERGAMTTRRSAGIPALLVAILSADPRSPLFDEAIEDLKKLAMKFSPNSNVEESELPQVHALNALKATLTNPKLTEQSELKIVTVMELAAFCLDSQIWSIRNCGLMLFRGLIDRLLGSNESLDVASNAMIFTGSRLSYQRYPGLLELVIRLLNADKPGVEGQNGTALTEEESNRNNSPEATFPVLDLLRRAPPPDSHLTKIRSLLLQKCQSPRWHVRDLAARTYTASIRPAEVTRVASEMLEVACSDQNEQHGRFLIVKYLSMAVSTGETPSTKIQFSSLLLSRLASVMAESVSPHAKAAYLSALNLLLESLLSMGTQIIPPELVGILNAREFSTLSLILESLQIKESLFQREALLYLCLLALLRDSMLENDKSIGKWSKTAFALLIQHVDTAVIVLDRIHQRLSKFRPSVSLHLAESLSSLLVDAEASRCRRGSERCLLHALNLLPLSGCSELVFSVKYLTEINVMDRIHEYISPSDMEVDIAIWGWSVAMKSQDMTLKLDDGFIRHVLSWLRCVQLALDPAQEYNLRHAAIQSARAFSLLSSKEVLTQPDVFISIAFAVYDGLNDDEEELRELAAHVSQGLLEHISEAGGTTRHFVPLVAATKLRRRMLEVGKSSQIFLRGAISRMLQQNYWQTCSFRSVKDILDDVVGNEDILFVVEKSNLYVDGAREAVVWSKALIKTIVWHGQPEEISAFIEWIMDGLDILLERAKTQTDGPLGWTSKPDVFVLGICVIRGAEVLLAWRTKTNKIKVKASAILTKLQELHDIGVATKVHELWISTLQNVLQRSVQMRLKVLVASLKRLSIDYC